MKLLNRSSCSSEFLARKAPKSQQNSVDFVATPNQKIKNRKGQAKKMKRKSSTEEGILDSRFLLFLAELFLWEKEGKGRVFFCGEWTKRAQFEFLFY